MSGLGASQEEAQEEVLVGMGLVAGSSVMVLTVLWGACLISGRCDLVQHSRTGLLVAKDKTLTKGFSLTGACKNILTIGLEQYENTIKIHCKAGA